MTHQLFSLFDRDTHLPRALRQIPSANIEKGWDDYLLQITDRLTNRGFAQGFYEAVPFEGADPSEYNYRLLRRSDLSFVSSLRFKALTMTEPFIEVMLCSASLDKHVVTSIGRIVKEEYARFRPDRVRYLSLDDSALWPEDQEDFAVYAGDVDTLRNSPEPPRSDEIELEAAPDLAFYPRLLSNYEKLFSERQLQPEPLSSLERSMDQGLLCEAFINHQWAGMMAAQRMTERFYTGVFVVEEIIDEQFRGQGFAPAMQRKFIDRLENDVMVFGEILAWNERSRRTAIRVGRKKCGTTFFHRIE